MKTLQELRIANRLSLRDLARLMIGTRGSGKGYQAALHRMERRELSPTIERLRDTLQAMGYSLELYACRNGERVPLEVTPRAKDAPVKDAPVRPPEPVPSPLVPPPEPSATPSKHPLESEPDTLQDTLLRALART
jgi:transcriptional regulator with XRE-family HTH domain